MLEQSLIVPDINGMAVAPRDIALDPALRDKITKNLVRMIHDMPHKGEELLGDILDTLAALQEKNTKLEEMALTDALTGAYNRRHFDKIMQEIDSENVRCERQKTGQHFLMLVDIDDFKFINDTYGHVAGDAALQHVTGILSSMTRATDSVCRYGGDEFVGILRDTTVSGALRKINEIELAINTSFMVWDGQKIPVRASIGSAEIKSDCITADILKRVDAQLYESKKVKDKRRAR